MTGAVSRGDGSREVRLTSFNDEWLSEVTLQPAEPLHWTVDSGAEIEGWVIEPGEARRDWMDRDHSSIIQSACQALNRSPSRAFSKGGNGGSMRAKCWSSSLASAPRSPVRFMAVRMA